MATTFKLNNKQELVDALVALKNGDSSTTTVDINDWDVSAVTDMSNLFTSYTGCNWPAFNHNIGNWNTSNVTDMQYMFSGCTAFDQNIGGWITSNVTNMESMFSWCSMFNQNIGGWDTTKVLNMGIMFYEATAFNQNISAWDVSKVRNFAYMFYNASAFDQDLSGWETESASSFGYMFEGATAFLQNQVSTQELLDRYKYWQNDYSGWNTITNVFGTDITVDTDFFNQPRPSAQSGGDPYVYPLAGPPTKLPNCSATYRMYQDTCSVINAEVRAASPEIQEEIVRAAGNVGAGLSPICAEAYFFSRVHVAQRSSTDAPWEHVTVDLENRTTSGSTETLDVGAPQLLAQPDQAYDPHARSHVCIPVRWGRGAGRRELLVHFSRNPQVRNGLSLRGPHLERGSGLLVRNFRPKLFAVPVLEATAPVQLPAACKRPLTQRAIRGPGECTLAVKC